MASDLGASAQERTRLALFALGHLRADDRRGRAIHDPSPGATAAPGMLPGVSGLLQPLREQAIRLGDPALPRPAPSAAARAAKARPRSAAGMLTAVQPVGGELPPRPPRPRNAAAW